MKYQELFRVLKKSTIYFSIPVYNITWLRRSEFYKGLLNELQITVVDVGARNSSLEELSPLQSYINYIGFDADEQEVRRLNNKSNFFNSSKFITAYVGPTNKKFRFALHHDAGNSSIYPFNEKYLKWFRGNAKDYVKSYFDMTGISLDDLLEEDVDVIKVDTQGTEYDIIKSAPKCLAKSLMVEIEVEFMQMYEGQKLAHDVFQLMHESGFELLYINRVFAQSSNYNGLSRGQIVFGDVLFGLSRDKALTLPLSKQLKYLALLINYGHIDFAHDIYTNNNNLRKELPLLDDFFARNGNQKLISKVFRSLIDKVIFLLLIARRYNGLKYDSDRSWPIR